MIEPCLKQPPSGLEPVQIVRARRQLLASRGTRSRTITTRPWWCWFRPASRRPCRDSGCGRAPSCRPTDCVCGMFLDSSPASRWPPLHPSHVATRRRSLAGGVGLLAGAAVEDPAGLRLAPTSSFRGSTTPDTSLIYLLSYAIMQVIFFWRVDYSGGSTFDCKSNGQFYFHPQVFW